MDNEDSILESLLLEVYFVLDHGTQDDRLEMLERLRVFFDQEED